MSKKYKLSSETLEEAEAPSSPKPRYKLTEETLEEAITDEGADQGDPSVVKPKRERPKTYFKDGEKTDTVPFSEALSLDSASPSSGASSESTAPLAGQSPSESLDDQGAPRTSVLPPEGSNLSPSNPKLMAPPEKPLLGEYAGLDAEYPTAKEIISKSLTKESLDSASYYRTEFSTLDEAQIAEKKKGTEEAKSRAESMSGIIKAEKQRLSVEDEAIRVEYESLLQMEQINPMEFPMAAERFNQRLDKFKRELDWFNLQSTVAGAIYEKAEYDAALLEERKYDIKAGKGSVPAALGYLVLGQTGKALAGGAEVLSKVVPTDQEILETIGILKEGSGKSSRDSLKQSIDALRDMPLSATGIDQLVTPEYVEKKRSQNLAYKGLFAVAEMTPALAAQMAGGGVPAMAATFFLSSYDDLGQEMQGPEWDQVSDAEKEFIRVGISAVSAGLSTMGLQALAGKSKWVNQIFFNAAKKMLPGMTAGEVRLLLDAETKSFVNNVTSKLVQGFVTEGAEEGVDFTLEEGAKHLYEELKRGEFGDRADAMFQNSESMDEFGRGLAESIVVGGIAGDIIAGSIGAASSIGARQRLNNKEFDVFRQMLQSGDLGKDFESNAIVALKTGKMTQAEYDKYSDNIATAKKAIDQIPEGLTTEATREAFDILLKKAELSKLDKNMTKGDIEALNTRLEELAAQKAAVDEYDAAEAAEAVSPEDTVEEVRSFKTSMGSEYTVHPDGTTTRNKAQRPEHGKDSGIKDQSLKTVYLPGRLADAMNGATNSVNGWRIVDNGDGTLGVLVTNDGGTTWNTPKPTKGWPEDLSRVKYETTPAKGLTPLELWQHTTSNGTTGYKKVHFGNSITEVRGVEAQPDKPTGRLAGLARGGNNDGSMMRDEDMDPYLREVRNRITATMGRMTDKKALTMVKALVPGLKIIRHDTEESFQNSRPPSRRSTKAKGYYDRDKKEIHIGPRSKGDTHTLAHELMHPVFSAFLGQDPKKLDALYDELISNPKFEIFREFGKQYLSSDEEGGALDQEGQELAKLEAIVDFLGAVADGKFDEQIQKDKGFADKLRDIINHILKTFGLNALSTDLSDAETLKDLAKMIASASKFDSELRMGKDKVVEMPNSGLRDINPTGVYFLYAGEDADMGGYDKDMQIRAEDMEARGDSMEEIRATTGWFRGKYDKKWRKEIDDSGASMKLDIKEITASPFFGDAVEYKLSDILDHPKLYEKYPDAANATFVLRPGLFDFMKQLQGGFNPKTGTIQLTPYAQDPTSTLLHEVQHWIQKKEGFARGGNESTAMEAMSDSDLMTAASKLSDKLDSEIRAASTVLSIAKKLNSETIDAPQWITDRHGIKRPTILHALYLSLNDFSAPLSFRTDIIRIAKGIIPDIYDSIEGEGFAKDLNFFNMARTAGGKTLARLEENFAETTAAKAAVESGDRNALISTIKKYDLAHELYLSLAGEIESRDVEARQGMSTSERHETEPYSSSDISPEDAIVAFNDQGESRNINEMLDDNLGNYGGLAGLKTSAKKRKKQLIESGLEMVTAKDAPFVSHGEVSYFVLPDGGIEVVEGEVIVGVDPSFDNKLLRSWGGVIIDQQASAPSFIESLGPLTMEEGSSAPGLRMVKDDAHFEPGSSAPMLGTVTGNVTIIPGVKEQGKPPVLDELRVVGNDLRVADRGDIFIWGEDGKLTTGVKKPGGTLKALQSSQEGAALMENGVFPQGVAYGQTDVEKLGGPKFPALVSVGGDLEFIRASSAPNLRVVFGNADIGYGSSVPSLTRIEGSANIGNSVIATSLSYVGGSLKIGRTAVAPNLTSLTPKEKKGLGLARPDRNINEMLDDSNVIPDDVWHRATAEAESEIQNIPDDKWNKLDQNKRAEIVIREANRALKNSEWYSNASTEERRDAIIETATKIHESFSTKPTQKTQKQTVAELEKQFKLGQKLEQEKQRQRNKELMGEFAEFLADQKAKNKLKTDEIRAKFAEKFGKHKAEVEAIIKAQRKELKETSIQLRVALSTAADAITKGIKGTSTAFAAGVSLATKEAARHQREMQKAVSTIISQMKADGPITNAQALALTRAAAQVKFANPTSVQDFYDYADRVLNTVAYVQMVNDTRKLQREARKKKHPKMHERVMDFTSINPKVLPEDLFADYMEAVSDLGKNVPSYANMNALFDAVQQARIAQAKTNIFDPVKTADDAAEAWGAIEANGVTSADEYVQLVRDINDYISAITKLRNEKVISNDQWDQLMDQVGRDTQAVEKKYARQLTKVKKDLLRDVRMKVSNIPNTKYSSKLGTSLLEEVEDFTDSQLQELKIHEIINLNDLLDHASVDGYVDSFRLTPLVVSARTAEQSRDLKEQVKSAKPSYSLKRALKEIGMTYSAFWESKLGLGSNTYGAYQKYVISPVERASGQYNKLQTDAVDFLVKKLKEHKIAKKGGQYQKTMVKTGMIMTYLREYGLSQSGKTGVDPKADNLEYGKRDIWHFIMKDKAFEQRYPDKNERKAIEEAYNSLPKDKNGRVNPEKVYQAYMSDNTRYLKSNEWAFMKDVNKWKEENLASKLRDANEMKGLPFKEVMFHISRNRRDGSATTQGEGADLFTIGANGMNVRVAAKGGKAAETERISAMDVNFSELFLEDAETIGRDYYYTPALMQMNRVLRKAHDGLSGVGKMYIEIMAKNATESLKYEFVRIPDDFSSRVARSTLRAQSVQILVNVLRTGAEVISAMVSYPARTGTWLKGYTEMLRSRKVGRSLIEDTDSPFINKNLHNRVFEVHGHKIEERGFWANLAFHLASAPEAMGLVPMWTAVFKQEFKKITGVPFSATAYKMDREGYKRKYRKAFADAGSVADAKYSAIAGPGTQSGQRREVKAVPRWLAKSFRVDPDNTGIKTDKFMGQALSWMTGYPNREWAQIERSNKAFMDAYRAIRAGEGLPEGTVGAVLSPYVGILAGSIAYSFMNEYARTVADLLLGDDDEAEEAKEKLIQMGSWEGLKSGFYNSSLATVVTVGSAKYSGAGKFLLSFVGSALYELAPNKDQKTEIKEFMNAVLWRDPLTASTAYDMRKSATENMVRSIPQMGAALDAIIYPVWRSYKSLDYLFSMQSDGTGLNVQNISPQFNTPDMIQRVQGKIEKGEPLTDQEKANIAAFGALYNIFNIYRTAMMNGNVLPLGRRLNRQLDEALKKPKPAQFTWSKYAGENPASSTAITPDGLMD